MMYGRLLALLLCLSMLISVRTLDCKPCDDDTLCENPVTSDDCTWGVVRRECFCCLECAKGPAESCGGLFNEHGICGPGMACITHTQEPNSVGICQQKFLATFPRPVITNKG